MDQQDYYEICPNDSNSCPDHGLYRRSPYDHVNRGNYTPQSRIVPTEGFMRVPDGIFKSGCSTVTATTGKATTTPACLRFGGCPGSAGCLSCATHSTADSKSSCNVVYPKLPFPLQQEWVSGGVEPNSPINLQEYATGGVLGIYYNGTDYSLAMSPYDNQVVEQSSTDVQFYPLGAAGTYGLTFAKIDVAGMMRGQEGGNIVYIQTTVTPDYDANIYSGDWIVVYTTTINTPFQQPDTNGPWFLGADGNGGFKFFPGSAYLGGDSNSPSLTSKTNNGYIFAFQIFVGSENWNVTNPCNPIQLYQGDPFFLWSWGASGTSNGAYGGIIGADFRTNLTVEGLVGYSGTNGTDTAVYDDQEGSNGVTPWILPFRSQAASYFSKEYELKTGIGTMSKGSAGYTAWAKQKWWLANKNASKFLYEDSKGNIVSEDPPPYTFMFFVATASTNCLGYDPNIWWDCTKEGLCLPTATGKGWKNDPNCEMKCGGFECQDGKCVMVPGATSHGNDPTCGGHGCMYGCVNGICQTTKKGTYTDPGCGGTCVPLGGGPPPDDDDKTVMYVGIAIGVIIVILFIFVMMR